MSRVIIEKELEIKMVSKSAQILLFGLKFIRLKDRVDFTHPKRSKVRPEPHFSSKYTSIKTLIQNRNVISLSLKDSSSHKHVVFFHGGGYSVEATKLHFTFIEKFIDQSKARFTFVDYPLAPEANVDDTLRMSMESYEYLIGKVPSDDFILMGDSAGGGLALALALKIRDKKLKRAEKIILLSPWLDLGCSHPKIPEIASLDMILDVSPLRKIGDLYRGSHSTTDPIVSPGNGHYDGLGDISVFVGTHEIFYYDCIELKSRHADEKVKIETFVYEDMPHDWLLFPIPESRKAIREVTDIINS
jgi:epsilon-lactone hydrolase